MATYQTKHLEATREISHGDKFLKPGETFHASEVDAEHYLNRGMAKHATAAPAPAKAAPAPAPAAQPARATTARTPRAQPAARASAPAPAPAEPPAALPAAEAAGSSWERTEPIKLADVPHPDVGTPSAEG